MYDGDKMKDKAKGADHLILIVGAGEHPDLGLLEGGEEDLLNFFNSGLEVPVPAPV